VGEEEALVEIEVGTCSLSSKQNCGENDGDEWERGVLMSEVEEDDAVDSG